ncbi:hypothetical protein [uncultured Megasphaera sp.]|uniref:hypothetical protein n=1 Tax=uncultured Megasphaera sp. TaxID=165188 RepID=UPI002613B879|nr:hypothetical protein [uncultured Megasphaera sp.]
MLLSKKTVFKDLDISYADIQDLISLEGNGTSPEIDIPKNEYTLFSFMKYMLDDSVFPILMTESKDLEAFTFEETIAAGPKFVGLWNLGWLYPIEFCMHYKEQLENVCNMYLNTNINDWNGEFRFLNRNNIKKDVMYQYTFQCGTRKLTYSFTSKTFHIFKSFHLLMELSFQGAKRRLSNV